MDKELIRNCFDSAARTYDAVASVQRSSSKDLVDLIELQGISSIIDIGCGTGYTSMALRKKYPNAAYTLCDISAEMLRVASEKFSYNVQTINCDAENYKFSQCDLAISNLSMQWFLDPCAFIRKVKRSFKTFAFSILTDHSFEKYKNYFEIPPFFDYPSVEQLIENTTETYQIKKYYVEFENFFDLAKYFKKLGAQAKANSKQTLKRNHDGKIILDYEVFMTVF